MADDMRRDMEDKAKRDAERIDHPFSQGGVAVPGDESQPGRLVGDAKAAFEEQQRRQGGQMQGQQGGQSAPRMETQPQRMGGGKVGDEMKSTRTSGMGGMGMGGMQGQGSRMMTMTAQAETLTVKGACAVARGEDVKVTGASGAVVSGGDTDFTGGTMAVVSGGETRIHAGGAPLIISGDEIEIEKGGGALLIARKVEVEENGFAGVAIGRVKVENGGKVLISTLPAILMGAAVGATFALVSSLLGGRSRGIVQSAREAVMPEEPGMMSRLAGAITAAPIVSSLTGGGESMMEQMRGASSEMMTRAARADSRRRMAMAMRDAQKAARQARKAARERISGRV